MKNLSKLGKALNKAEQKNVLGGRAAALTNECPSGEMQCNCNGQDYGCVCSVQECWDLC